MKIFKRVPLTAGSIGLSGLLLASPAMSEPGKGWDTFNMGQGDPIPVAGRGNTGASAGDAPVGKGWDTFRMGQGDPIPVSSRAAPAHSARVTGTVEAWQVFYTGERNKL